LRNGQRDQRDISAGIDQGRQENGHLSAGCHHPQRKYGCRWIKGCIVRKPLDHVRTRRGERILSRRSLRPIRGMKTGRTPKRPNTRVASASKSGS
jgi:hypothetical protein